MNLFRKNALVALNAPDRLDQPMQLLRPSYWCLLIAFCCFSSSILLWSVFGRIPVRINGKGVLIRSESLQRVQSETSGRIKELSVQVGECVSKGTALARIESTDQDLDRDVASIQLELLLKQDSQEDSLAVARRAELEQQLSRVMGLSRHGAISQDDVDQRRQQLTSARLELESRNNQRHREIQQQRNQIRNLNISIMRKATVRAPFDGCVIDRQVKLGDVIQPGSTLFELDAAPRTGNLQSLAFFSPGDGKRLKPGQRVQITPASTKAQRHGGIEGQILTIRALPVSEEAVISRLGNPAWTKALSDKNEPMIEVVTSLKRNQDTFSGYDWGAGNGPDLSLSAGTPTSVRVLVEERRPISYVIPLLRDVSGIY